MENCDTTKYVIHAKINTNGVIERPDVVGAIFGQTEGLLGNDLDLRELQKTGRIGRIDVNITVKAGKASGMINIPSSLDRVDTAILAASLETIDRVGPCVAYIEVVQMEDVRMVKRNHIITRAKTILIEMFNETVPESQEIAAEVRKSLRVEEMIHYGKDKLPAGPHIHESDAIIVVEGRADVLNLLRCGIKNAIAVGGTNVPASIADICENKIVTAFTDGDRGGELIIKELLQIADIDFIARAPDGKGVEELVQKEIVTALRQKLPVDQVIEQYRIKSGNKVADGKPKKITRKKVTRTVESITKQERVLPLKREIRQSTPERDVPDAPKRDVLETPKRKTSYIPEREISKPILEDEFEVVEPEVIAEPHPLKSHLDELKGTLNARFVDGNGDVINEFAIRNLEVELGNSNDNVKNIVFDGAITQRMVDMTSEKDIDCILGLRTESIVKCPANIQILTERDIR